MKQQLVPQKDIDHVINGLMNYFQHSLMKQQFNPIDLKNFMEPIFSEAGYRQRIKLQDSMGGG